jgi:hypothetical protein
VAYLKLLFRHSPLETEKNYETSFKIGTADVRRRMRHVDTSFSRLHTCSVTVFSRYSTAPIFHRFRPTVTMFLP